MLHKMQSGKHQGDLEAPQRGSVLKDGDPSSKKWTSPQKCGPVHTSEGGPVHARSVAIVANATQHPAAALPEPTLAEEQSPREPGAHRCSSSRRGRQRADNCEGGPVHARFRRDGANAIGSTAETPETPNAVRQRPPLGTPEKIRLQASPVSGTRLHPSSHR